MLLLKVLNLTQIREKVLMAICAIVDKDSDGGISFDEFCTRMMAEDILLVKKNKPKPPPSPRGAPKASSGHVDHALEMFRTGSNAGAYSFDGDVAGVGAGDSAPVTLEELERAHDMIREKMTVKFGNMAKAFQAIDEDRSGKVSHKIPLEGPSCCNLTNDPSAPPPQKTPHLTFALKSLAVQTQSPHSHTCKPSAKQVTKAEALRLLMLLNLPQIREKVLNEIGDIVDADGDGIEFKEFCAMMVSDDILPLKSKAQALKGK